MNILKHRENWDAYYKKERAIDVQPKEGWFMSYDIYLCRHIIKKYLGGKKYEKICEIGSGDGKLVKDISDIVGGEPHGIDYSSEGLEKANKRGVKTIIGDVFNMVLREEFDLVFSYGFIEHYDDPREAIEVHLKLLKRGGYFFIQIPRLRYFHWWKTLIFRKEHLKWHNLKIMEAEELEKACVLDGVKKIWCGNYGTMKFRLPIGDRSIRQYIMKVICLLEYITNPLFRFLFGAKGFETKWFSPSVMFIGKKL